MLLLQGKWGIHIGNIIVWNKRGHMFSFVYYHSTQSLGAMIFHFLAAQKKEINISCEKLMVLIKRTEFFS